MSQPDLPESESFRSTFNASLSDAVRRSGLGQLPPGEVPSGRALIQAVGGPRGLAESLLPGLGFLVTYALTQQLVASVLAPVVLSLAFVALRLVGRTPPALAFAGLFGVAFSAVLALLTGKPEDNFVPGLVINAGSVLVLLVSIAVRWPLIGIIVGALVGDFTGWRRIKSQRVVLTVATWMWAGMFGLRLAVQAPLYFSGATEVLAGTKLLMGVPLYAGMVWVTWLLVRSAFGAPSDEPLTEDKS